jgi:hypothetical protein
VGHQRLELPDDPQRRRRQGLVEHEQQLPVRSTNYTTTQTSSESHWTSGGNTLSQSSGWAAYSGSGLKNGTNIEISDQTHANADDESDFWANASNYTSTSTDNYIYAGSSNNASSPSGSSSGSVDVVTQTVDSGFTWQNAGLTLGTGEEWTLSQNGHSHMSDVSTPSVTVIGAQSGRRRPKVARRGTRRAWCIRSRGRP